MAGATSTPASASSKRGGGRGASGRQDEDEITEYEKQRLSRIRENRARLEALGLPNLASSLLAASGYGKRGQATDEGEEDVGKRRRNRKRRGENGDYEDEEYHPSDEDEGGESSSSGEEKTDEEKEGRVPPSGARQTPRGKGHKKNSSHTVKVGKQSSIQQGMNEFDVMEDDVALQQAIALSLEEPMNCPGAEANRVSQVSAGVSTSAVQHGKDVGKRTQEKTGRGKRKKENVKRPQMTEDELVAYFFSLDEAGKGGIMLHDLVRVAVAHDFSWTQKEMADMIHLFDSNRDGKLSLDDFRGLVSRCNMMREPGN